MIFPTHTNFRTVCQNSILDTKTNSNLMKYLHFSSINAMDARRCGVVRGTFSAPNGSKRGEGVAGCVDNLNE